MTTEEAKLVVGNPGHWNNEAWNQGAIKVAREMAISALTAQAERENPQPLTLEQLRERDGKPVWCIDGRGYGAWCLVDVYKSEVNCIDSKTGMWEGCFYDMRVAFNSDKLHYTGWLAYDTEVHHAK